MELFIRWLSIAIITSALTSCKTFNLDISSVGYQSVRTTFAQPDKIPDDAKIAIEYFINERGEVLAVVYNLSDEIITINQTKSFLIDTNGQSISYYDPTVRSTTSGDFESGTAGATFNLGAISNIFGIGGPLGNLLNSTTVGGARTSGSFSSNTVTVTDQPEVRIGPKGRMVMSKQFGVTGIGRQYLTPDANSFPDCLPAESPLKFSVCVSYALEDGVEKKLVTDFYVNSTIVISDNPWKTNDAFHRIYKSKSDALAEPSFMFIINTNFHESSKMERWGELHLDKVFDAYVHGSLIDYQ